MGLLTSLQAPVTLTTTLTPVQSALVSTVASVLSTALTASSTPILLTTIVQGAVINNAAVVAAIEGDPEAVLAALYAGGTDDKIVRGDGTREDFVNGPFGVLTEPLTDDWFSVYSASFGFGSVWGTNTGWRVVNVGNDLDNPVVLPADTLIGRFPFWAMSDGGLFEFGGLYAYTSAIPGDHTYPARVRLQNVNSSFELGAATSQWVHSDSVDSTTIYLSAVGFSVAIFGGASFDLGGGEFFLDAIITGGSWQASPVGLQFGGTGFNYSTVAPGAFWAGPAVAGPDGAPTFRAIVDLDIPATFVGDRIHTAATKATPVDDDQFTFSDSAAAWVLKKVPFLNLLATIAARFGERIDVLTSKATPVDADELILADSAASWASKKLILSNLKAFLKTYFDPLYGYTWSSVTGATSYTLAAADNGVAVRFNAATTITVTVPTGVLTNGFRCALVQEGAGQIEVVASGTTPHNPATAKTRALYSMIVVHGKSTVIYTVQGDLAAS